MTFKSKNFAYGMGTSRFYRCAWSTAAPQIQHWSLVRLWLNKILSTGKYLCSVLTHTWCQKLLIHDEAKIQMYCCYSGSAVPLEDIVLIFNY